jgi:hypothetical protein
MQVNFLLRDAPQNVDDFSLNCRLVRLNLPAVEIRAVVGDGELEMAHSNEEGILTYSALGTNRLPGFTAALPSRQSGHSSG